MKIAIINGPNLNLLGKREPEIYGNKTFDEFFNELKAIFPEIEFTYFQSNIEGEIIDKLHEVGFEYNGIVLNAAAYTHTSVGLGDSVKAISAPVIEVHISNVYAREEFRQHSYISEHAEGIIVGLGLNGYSLAIKALISQSK